jgi:4-hydroxybenzoate polyprenyltransferase
MATAESGVGERLRAVAALVRVPNLFTAVPDVVLGAALALGAGPTASVPTIAALGLASLLLYAAGTTLNDYADAPVDREQRPERPIPGGQITRRSALVLGVVLLLAGVLTAAAAAGVHAGAVAAALAAVIVLYDGVCKGSAAGFLVMGGARGLNVLLGTTAGGDPLGLPGSALAVPAVIALYIAAVTYMAASETTGGNRPAVLTAIGGTVVAAVAVVARLAVVRPAFVAGGVALALTAAFLAWTGRALLAAARHPTPATVGPAVGTCVLGLVVLDAAFAATVGVGWALAAVAFLLPAIGLSRVFDVT